MVRLIITHPGGAHKDDLLAVSVLASLHGAPIVRREPTPAEIADPNVATVDIGGVHDAEKQNFDHHHFPREHEPTCALSLVLEDLGLYEDGLRFCDWLKTAEMFDSRGPKRTAEWLGVPRRAISQLNSPVDITILRRFAQSQEHKAGELIYDFLCLIGEDLLRHLREARERIDFVAKHASSWSIPCGKDTCEAVFLPRTDPETDEPSTSLASYIRAEQDPVTTAAMIYPDRRGDGYGISRYEDHPQLDFSRIEGEVDVHFAHKTGFVCKTSATNPERLRELIALSWLES
jgi:hypothetical protein